MPGTKLSIFPVVASWSPQNNNFSRPAIILKPNNWLYIWNIQNFRGQLGNCLKLFSEPRQKMSDVGLLGHCKVLSLYVYLSVTHLDSLDQSVKCQLALKTLKDYFF